MTSYYEGIVFHSLIYIVILTYIRKLMLFTIATLQISPNR
jgi:hypothetical protein